MKRKKGKKGGPKECAGWMASYADMFTVLMVFFVLLFAMSQVDAELFERFLISFNPARAEDRPLRGAGYMFLNEGSGLLSTPVIPPDAGAAGDEGGIGPDIPDKPGGREPEGDAVGDMYNTFKTYMAEVIPADISSGVDGTEGDGGLYADGFEIQYGENYILVEVMEQGSVFFNSGQAMLTSAARDALNIIGPLLKEFSDEGHGIIIEGHTDNRPINTPQFPSNWTLSGARASSVVEYFVNTHEIDRHMIAGLGRGEYFPKADNNTEAGRAANRRVEIKVFTSEATMSDVIGSWFIPGTR
jgi:chemotaxis protein MotB